MNINSRSYLTGYSLYKLAATPAWQRSEGKSDAGGLNQKGRDSYNRETGGNLKAPVTEKNPKGKRKSRQDSFCARMCGMKRRNTGSATASDPDSRINKALRRWNCKCSECEKHATIVEKICSYVGDKESEGKGLWANIRAKRRRGEKPAKPGDKDYPESKAWNSAVQSSQ